MSEELLKKLRYKEGQSAVMHAPEGFNLGIDADASAQGKYDFVLLFVNNAKEAEERVRASIPFLNENALFWVAYPKQSSKVKTDINRDSLFRIVQDTTPYVAVSNVAIDEKWSSLRLRHKDKVGK